MAECKASVNHYWEKVKEKYPDARFDFWYRSGELHFYPDGESEREQKNLGACYRNDDGKLVVMIGDAWRD